MNDKYELRSDIDVPPRGSGLSKYPFAQMKVGDSFAVPDEELQKARRTASSQTHRSREGRKYAVRKHPEHGHRCWRIA